MCEVDKNNTSSIRQFEFPLVTDTAIRLGCYYGN